MKIMAIEDDTVTDEPPLLEEIEEDEEEPSNESEMILEQDPEFSHLNGSYLVMGNQGWTNHCLSIINDFWNVEATLVTPQYGFEKGLKVFGKKDNKATMEKLDENLLGKNVIDMINPSDVTWSIFKYH